MNIANNFLFHMKATPHKERLTPLSHICLQIFRHTAQKFLNIRQYACGIFVQSDEKFNFASVRQSLCSVALNLVIYISSYFQKRKYILYNK